MPLVPDLEHFRLLAAQANTIPVYREVAADLDTPVSAFLKLHRSGQGFLLESVEGGDRWGRYSVLGTDPLMTLRSRGGVTVVEKRGGSRMEIEADPVEALRRVLAPFHQARVDGLSRFAGGFVGYLSYDLVRTIEKLPEDTVDDLGAADIAGLIADNFVLFDNVTHTMKVVSLAVVGASDDVTAAYERAAASVEATVQRLRTSEIPLPPAARAQPERPVSNHTPQEYAAAVERCLEYIRAGDIFQVVLSQRFSGPLACHPFSIYRALRTVNPSPYMFYLDLEGEIVVGASPEVMVKVDGDQVAVRPIAGTVRRGATPAEDEALIAQMLADPKEQAEHIMLVDLGRNDIGRVAEVGTVKVGERFTVERYSHVNHIVSHVSGKLAEGRDCFDAFRATFPAGTLSGAPKVRAMEIIEEIEKTRRGVYGGAVGYIDFLGNLDTCIAIRTLFVKNGTVYVQAGAGIVADSVPINEQAECEAKAGAMMLALQRATELET
ncbi:MAG TPA: anthranilate synthase component I [Candidatus Binatia bacterium]|nr:anthranilate synthase component I [Candidatus Binatia bacterium]